jgi:hypothetical protein
MLINRSEVYKMIIERRQREAYYETKKETFLEVMNGIFTDHTGHGGYPIFFLDQCDVLCATCARQEFLANRTSENAFFTDIYYEGPAMRCEECGCLIDSAYGDPLSGDDDDDDDDEQEDFNARI